MRNLLVVGIVMLSGLLSATVFAQLPASVEKPVETAAPSLKIEIPDEPQAFDPATLMPPELAKRVTHEFKRTSLREVIQWLQQEQQLKVIVDAQALSNAGVLISDQVSERLENEPLYQLLDRLQSLQLAWYVADGNVHLTTTESVSEHYITIPYNIGDLLDAGIEDVALLSTIEQSTSGPWDADEPGTGTLVQLGDVLFVRQTDSMQREVSALLTALQKPSRRTLLLDCPQHAGLREKLEQRISVNFQETAFEEAVSQLAALAMADIRIDRSLSTAGIRNRQPVTLAANEQKLRTIIQGLAIDVKLVPLLRDGVLWIATEESASERYHTAVFDVRDLCRNSDESSALTEAILSQTAGPWDDNEPGTGTLEFPLPGTMVVRQTEAQLDAVLELLENYRIALRASKPRKPHGPDPKELVTHYYRMSSEMADDLGTTLPVLVSPESWKTPETPDQPGTLHVVKSQPKIEVLPATAAPVKTATAAATQTVVSVSYSVLIIRQTRETHLKIGELIQKIEYGDASENAIIGISGGGGKGRQGGQGGGQQGGFGGGFFLIKP